MNVKKQSKIAKITYCRKTANKSKSDKTNNALYFNFLINSLKIGWECNNSKNNRNNMSIFN